MDPKPETSFCRKWKWVRSRVSYEEILTFRTFFQSCFQYAGGEKSSEVKKRLK